jgi:hypothetical protein
LPAKAVVILYVVLDGIVTPVVRPLLGWVARLRFVIGLQEIVAALPPYAILALLAVPFAFAEPAKIYALYLMTKGQVARPRYDFDGLSREPVVVERIYHAGRAKLKRSFGSPNHGLVDRHSRSSSHGRGQRGSGHFPEARGTRAPSRQSCGCVFAPAEGAFASCRIFRAGGAISAPIPISIVCDRRPKLFRSARRMHHAARPRTGRLTVSRTPHI